MAAAVGDGLGNALTAPLSIALAAAIEKGPELVGADVIEGEIGLGPEIFEAFVINSLLITHYRLTPHLGFRIPYLFFEIRS